MFSSLMLAALAAAQAAAPGSSGTVKWVPLNQANGAQATSQQPAPAQAAQPSVAQAAPAARFLPAGTQVSLASIQELSSKHIKEGERYQFTVVTDVTESGVVVIPRGSIATGVVTMQTGRAIGGKSGKFDITFEKVEANGVTFPLMGVHRQEGKGNTVGALLGSILISGRSAVMLPGQIVTAMIKERTTY
jgi:hypothetical protein